MLAGLAVDLAQRLPEAERAVADGQLGASLQAPTLEVEQQLLPALCAFSIAIDDGHDVLVALRVGPDDHQYALLVAVHARRKVHPVGPEIDIAPG